MFDSTPGGRAAADRPELRRQVADRIAERTDALASEAVAVFPFTGPQTLQPDEGTRLAEAALALLIANVRNGPLDSRDGLVADLRHLSQDRSISPQQLFGLMYLLERAALDALALDEAIGEESEGWTSLTGIVRRASFDALGAFAERLVHEPAAGAVIDPLTTLHAGPVFDAVLEKEIQRAERFGHPVGLILFDVDRLSEINAKHGYGFGDRVLERIGIVMRSYFREQDWVARHDEDTFVVLLPETMPEYAELLAERVRTTVEERLALRDYRNDERVRVTVSVAVVIAEIIDSDIKVDQMLRLAEQAVHRAKHAGRNRVETIDIGSRSLSVQATAKYLALTQEEVLRLVHAGSLPATERDRSLRFDRAAVEAFRAARGEGSAPPTD
jgi:diguanylate cyclase (GGDEF)-like protein/excisionase family DNA binding protein